MTEPPVHRPGPTAARHGPAVHLEGVVAGWTDVPVCAPATLTLHHGGVAAFVGPNGAGKSTLLRTVLGLLPPLSGTVRVHGAAPDDRSARFRRRVASVLDEDAWFPGLTVREHLLLVARGHGAPDARSAVDDVLETFGLDDAAAELPALTSSGQRRRLLLAAAFVRPADLVVLDEPEQRLDTRMRQTLATLLTDRAEQGTAVLLATHDPALLVAVDARALVVSDHRCEILDAREAAARMGA